MLCTVFAYRSTAAQTTAGGTAGQIIHVGATRDIKTIAAAARLVRDDGIVEVDAGDYLADVAVWDKRNLTVRAAGGRVRLIANEASAEGKAIWVVRSEKMQVEGFDFSGAAVPSRNGAGIRFEKGWLVVRDCSFIGNENGILTSNNRDSQLDIEDSEFAHNGFGDGQSHNLYAGEIARLSVTGSHFHHAKVGHLLKTRAALNDIRYNRLTDETGGEASYELEFPNGGVAYVIGNIIQQSASTSNPHLISYGAEGYKWPRNELYLVHNTLLDDRPEGGVFLRVSPGADLVRTENNLLVGNAKDTIGEPARNFRAAFEDLVDRQRGDYHLKKGSRLIGKAVQMAADSTVQLSPQREYAMPRGSIALRKNPINPGAPQN
ncbi:hypothetical protein RD110_21585 [Rhodoferax koreense]|uniref:Right handed beta helix domain-containing protein n=2 Tax=Rhodoferax koreensis TaxID=1842727 RepID=A0A1P8K0G1_9BURK|nr:hypothetical protein RD110_21585 [Rhodoferax koreense]